MKVYCRYCEMDIEITQATFTFRRFIKCPICRDYIAVEKSDRRGRKVTNKVIK